MKHSEANDVELMRRANAELDRKPSSLWATYLCLFITYVMLWCLMQ